MTEVGETLHDGIETCRLVIANYRSLLIGRLGSDSIPVNDSAAGATDGLEPGKP